jgi:hypothetical protein
MSDELESSNLFTCDFSDQVFDRQNSVVGVMLNA